MSTSHPPRELRVKRLPLYVALAAAVAGVALLETYKARFEVEVTGGEWVDVLTVARDIEVGQHLKATDVTVEAMPVRFVDRRRARAADRDEIFGVRTRMALTGGDALNYDDLALAKVDGRDLSALVPDGLRAVSVSVDAFDGLLRPGDRVDVLDAATAEPGEARGRLLLQRCLVLAVEGRTSGQARRASAGQVVLAVTTEEAEALAGALRSGRITLALRNPGDLVTSAVSGPEPAATSAGAKPREVERVR